MKIVASAFIFSMTDEIFSDDNNEEFWEISNDHDGDINDSSNLVSRKLYPSGENPTQCRYLL
jgi:hypothetical protein